jgi:hypothetical protein
MPTKTYIKIIVLFFIIFNSSLSQAVDLDFKWSELRVFIGGNNLAKDPTELNNLGNADNVEDYKSFTGIGLEADAQLAKKFKVGTRIKGIWNSMYPPNAPNPPTSYVAISQYSAGFLGRLTLIDTENVLVDVVAELGLANTKFDVKTTSSGNGMFTKDAGFFQRLGATVGLGWPSVKFYIEAGQEWNKLDDIKFEGTITHNLTSLDLSGPYYVVGVIISGIPSWIKPGGVSYGK